MPANISLPAGASTVFHPMCGIRSAASRSTVPGHSPQPSVVRPCSMPRSNSTCMPTQIPRTGRPGPEDARALDLVEPGHAGGVRTDTGDDQAVGSLGLLSIGAEGDVGTGVLDGAYDGAKIARPVVEHHDLRPGHIELRARVAP